MLLRTQLEIVLCDRLEQGWSDELTACKSARKASEKLAAEAEAAKDRLYKVDGQGSKWRSFALERPASTVESVAALNAAAAEARYALASRLQRFYGRNTYELLEILVASVDAHVRYYDHSSETAERLRQSIHDALEVRREGRLGTARAMELFRIAEGWISLLSIFPPPHPPRLFCSFPLSSLPHPHASTRCWDGPFPL